MKRPVLIVALIAGVLACAAIGFVVYSAICPCEATPGGYLFGETASEPVEDWGFANDVRLCRLQIMDGIRPHSINLNCMATSDGALYLSCSVCERKYWASKVEANEAAILRLNGVRYPVTLNRVILPAEMGRAWRARVHKLQTHGGGPYNPKPDPEAERPDHWWTFRVTWRAGD